MVPHAKRIINRGVKVLTRKSLVKRIFRGSDKKNMAKLPCADLAVQAKASRDVNLGM